MRIGPQWVGRHRLSSHQAIYEARRLSLRGQAPFGSDLIAWFAASDVSGGDGASVSTWKDRSPHGNDLLQATGANQPTLQTDLLNGYPAVRLDGSNDFMQTAADSSLEQANITCYLVCEPTSVKQTWVVGHPHDTTHTSPFFRWGIFLDGNNNNISIRWNSGVSSSTLYNSQEFLSFQFLTLSDNTLWFDGREWESAADADLTYPNSVGMLLGSNADGNENFTGDVYELLLYDNSHTASERKEVWNYLARKYGIVA